MSTRIERLISWEALDSRGTPTVGCEVVLEGGARGRATVPSGASTGTFEAVELRDGGERYRGRGVLRAVANVTGELAGAVVGKDAADQRGLDEFLRGADGTADLSRLGANAVLAISIASAIAVAADRNLPLWQSVADGARPLLPLPMVNIVSGGAHAGRSIDVQDFLAVPLGAARFAEAIEWSARTRSGVAAAMEDRGFGTALVADEGGLSAALPSNRSALELLVEGIERAGLRPGDDVAIAIDVAATQLGGVDEGYALASEGRSLTASEFVDELAAWCAAYPIVSIEDSLGEDDWEGWVDATARLGGRQLLGDDLFVTNRARVERGIAAGAANAVLVKPNQIGTLTDARDVVTLAHANDYATVLSARSGETEDDWLADLAVGWRTGQIKVGSTMRSERTAKWNRLIRLEHELGDDAVYAGASALDHPAT